MIKHERPHYFFGRFELTSNDEDGIPVAFSFMLLTRNLEPALIKGGTYMFQFLESDLSDTNLIRFRRNGLIRYASSEHTFEDSEDEIEQLDSIISGSFAKLGIKTESLDPAGFQLAFFCNVFREFFPNTSKYLRSGGTDIGALSRELRYLGFPIGYRKQPIYEPSSDMLSDLEYWKLIRRHARPRV